MSEDSKKLANTGAHGIKLTFHAIDPIPTDEFVSMMEGLLRSVGDKVNQRGGPYRACQVVHHHPCRHLEGQPDRHRPGA